MNKKKIHTEIKPFKNKYYCILNGEIINVFSEWVLASNFLYRYVCEIIQRDNKESAINNGIKQMKQYGILTPRNEEREVEKAILKHYAETKD